MTRMNYSLNHSRSLSGGGTGGNESYYHSRNGKVRTRGGKPGTAKPIKLKAKYAGICAICDEPYRVGNKIYYKHDKPPGKKCVHVACYDRRKRNK